MRLHDKQRATLAGEVGCEEVVAALARSGRMRIVTRGAAAKALQAFDAD